MGNHVARMGDRRGAYRVRVGRPEEKRPHGRPRLRWEGSIKIDVQEVEWGHGLDRWRALLNAVMNLRVP
jgi:hypothetical protein